jgi:hypothetical protein
MGVSRTIRINAEQDIRVAKTIKKYWNGTIFYRASRGGQSYLLDLMLVDKFPALNIEMSGHNFCSRLSPFVSERNLNGLDKGKYPGFEVGLSIAIWFFLVR